MLLVGILVLGKYDQNGNLISDGTNTYSYDYDNRLVNVIPAQAGIQNISYTYDPFGRRTQKNINGEITNYIYDGDDIIAEYNTEGELTAKYIHGANTDEILCAIRYRTRKGVRVIFLNNSTPPSAKPSMTTTN